MKDAIGAPVPRKEDQRLVTGRGRYVSDLQLPQDRARGLPAQPARARPHHRRGRQPARRRRASGPCSPGRISGTSCCVPGPPCRATSRPTSRSWPPTRSASPARRSRPWWRTPLPGRGRARAGRGRLRAAAGHRRRRGVPSRRYRCTPEAPDNVLLERTFAAGDAEAPSAPRTRRGARARHQPARGQPDGVPRGRGAVGARAAQADLLERHPGAAHRPQHDRRAAGPARGQRPGRRARRRRRLRGEGRCSTPRTWRCA